MKKSLEELQLDLIEVQAYRNLQDDEFIEDCFMDYDMWDYILNKCNQVHMGSEDEYFSIVEQSLKEAIKYYDENNNNPIKKNNKPRLNQYERKLYGNNKIKKARENWDYNRKWWKIYNGGKTVKFYKQYANQKVRTTDKKFKLVGRNYRKIFDYWWTID